MISRLSKYLTKLHLSGLVYSLLKPFCHDVRNIQERDEEKSYDYLKSLSKDEGESCICENNIDDSSSNIDLQIIIPAYNVEKYVGDCVDSVLSQTTKYKYIITIVNDGSKDGTRNVLRKYENNKNVVIIDQNNKGFSGARNTALKNIKAKYVTFLDSDDMLADGAIDAWMDMTYSSKADVVEGGYQIFYNNTTRRTFKHKNEIIDHWVGTLYGYPWGKVFKAKIFDKIHFPEKYWFEDTLISLIVYPSCKTFATIDKIVYKYRINYQGITYTARHNCKVVDSYWITETLLKDRAKLEIKDDGSFAEFLLFQLKVNFGRIHSLNDKEADVANFILSVYLFEKYCSYPKQSRYNEIALAMQKRDFGIYKLACILK